MQIRVLFASIVAATLAVPIPVTTKATGSLPASQTPARPIALPDTPAGRCAAAYLKAFSAGDDEMRAFIREARSPAYIAANPVESQVKFYRAARESSGTLVVDRFSAVSDFEIIVVVRMALRPESALGIRFRVQSTAPHYLEVLQLNPAPLDPRFDAVVIDAATLGRTIDALAALVRKAYVTPQMGEELAGLIVANRTSGRYADITNGVLLAARLTADLRARAQDLHLGVFFGPLPGRTSPRPGPAGAVGSAAIPEARILDGNIGYIRLNRLEPRDQAQPAIAKAMAAVRPGSALVFDLRSCMGGDPQTVELVAGYLFDTRVVLGTRHSRLHKEVREFRSENVGRNARFDADKPVYVLTSRRTGSGCEMFAGALQDLKRAVLVGETTGGAGHAAMDMAVTDLFWVRMPYAMVLSPVSKRGWERTGVSPDIQVPEDGALDAAVQDARKRLASKGRSTL